MANTPNSRRFLRNRAKHPAVPRHLVPKVRSPIQCLAESGVVGIVFSRMDGLIVDANDAFLRTVGHSRQDLELGRLRWTELTPPDWIEASERTRARISTEGFAPAFEKEYVRKDGSRVPVLIGVAPLSAAKAARANFVTFVVDISARKQAEGERDRLWQERVAMLESVGDGIFGADREGHCTFVNRAATEMLGYSAEECLGRNVHDLIHPVSADGSRHSWEECLIFGAFESATGVHSDCEVALRRDGTSVYVEGSAFPVIQNGRVESIVISFKDITARKKAEMALQASEARYRNIVENAHEGICMCDAQRQITYCNPRLASLIGHPQDRSGLTCPEFHFPEDNDESCRRFDRVRQGHIETYETRLRHKDGSARWMSGSASPIQDETGGFAGAVCMFSDITERKRLEEQLRHSQKMEAVGQLAGGIAHDFNNLLTVILGYGDVLERKLPSGDPLRASVLEIRKAGGRAASLIQKLLAFSRKQVLHPQVISLNQLVQELEPMLRRLLGEDIQLDTTLGPAAGNIKADPVQIEQVLMNLSINARDAMRQNGLLLIETQRQVFDARAGALHGLPPGAYAALIVTDTGSGMDQNTKARIFEPFFTTKEPGIGTGLGLSTVLGIVNQSGGGISVYSEPGVGTTFKVYLPSADAAVSSVKPLSPPASQHAGGSILLVEDDPGILRLASELLREQGYQVAEASSAEDALALCRSASCHPDLLLTDVILGGVDGHELANQLVSADETIQVLYMSGYTERTVIQQGILEPGRSFLSKPFRPDELLWKVAQAFLLKRGPARILIVDDDPQMRLLLASELEARGYSVVLAANGREAQAHLLGAKVDLVITDLVMPEQEGLETILDLRQKGSRIPVIAISGASGGVYLDVARKLGANAILPKPFTTSALATEIQRLLAER